jgi:hypothetical protein
MQTIYQIWASEGSIFLEGGGESGDYRLPSSLGRPTEATVSVPSTNLKMQIVDCGGPLYSLNGWFDTDRLPLALDPDSSQCIYEYLLRVNEEEMDGQKRKRGC